MIETSYPLKEDTLKGMQGSLPHERPEKPVAFVYGHGGWNGFNEVATKNWTGQINDAISETMPWLNDSKAADGVTPRFWPRLFITPNAAGVNKPEQFACSQGNAVVSRFEHNISDWIHSGGGGGGLEHLGIYNLTIQNTSPVSNTSAV